MTAQQSNSDESSTDIEVHRLSNIMQFAHSGMNGVNDMISGFGDSSSSVRTMDILDLVSRHHELTDGSRVAIRTRLTNKPGGYLLVMFSQSAGQKITRVMVSDMVDSIEDVDQSMAKSANKELGNMIISGFANGCADYLDTKIDYAAPKLVHANGSDIIKQTATMDDNKLVFAFDTTLTVNGLNIPAEIYLLPNVEEFVELITESVDG